MYAQAFKVVYSTEIIVQIDTQLLKILALASILCRCQFKLRYHRGKGILAADVRNFPQKYY